MLIPARLKLVIGIAVAVYACLAWTPAHGQDRPESDRGRPAGQALNIKETDIPLLMKLAKDAGISLDYSSSTTTEHAAGEGASATATGDKLDQKLDSSSPGAKLSGGASATGGDTQAKQHAEVLEAPWFRIMLAITGIALGLGAAWKFKKGELDTAAGLAGASAIFLLVAWMPALIWLLIIAGLGVAAPHFLPDKAKKALEERAAKAESALAAVVAGVHYAPDSAALAVKAEIEKQASPQDTDTIKNIKRTTLPT